MLIIAALLTGLAKTSIPGLASIAAALYALVLPAKESTGMMLVLLLAGDLLAIWAYRHDANFKLLRRLVVSVLTGVVAGAIFMRFVTQAQMRKSIGIILLLLVVLTIWQRRRKLTNIPANKPMRAIAGALAGFTTMVANAGGPVTSMYFLACKFSVKTFLGTTAWFFFLVNLSKLPFTISLGLIQPQHLQIAAFLVPIVLFGALAGRALARRLTLAVFEPLVIITTIISTLPLPAGLSYNDDDARPGAPAYGAVLPGAPSAPAPQAARGGAAPAALVALLGQLPQSGGEWRRRKPT